LEDLANIDFTEILIGRLEDIEIEILREIDKALERIEEGTYGYCEVCGKPIEEKRLEAIPWTTLCKEHAEELERERAMYERRHLDYIKTFNPPKDFKLSDENF
ncbi:MAG: TraR/DksA family transcriptional regulator, partial [Candidatus Nanohaloarchaeota archaeon]|nr:TraR/DksA family transcriptional regulator [Candidatus Nanohaloarchaeota archaeon]